MLIMATITENLHNHNTDLLWLATKIVSNILQNLLEKYYSGLLPKKYLNAMEGKPGTPRGIAGGEGNERRDYGIT